jgi:hypothetical protein
VSQRQVVMGRGGRTTGNTEARLPTGKQASRLAFRDDSRRGVLALGRPQDQPGRPWVEDIERAVGAGIGRDAGGGEPAGH